VRAVIIGAGVAGLATGWRLLQAGWRVTLLDRGQPGHGATWAAAGMLAVTAELEDAADSERALALEADRLWSGFAAELEAAAGQTVGYRQDGTLILAADGAELEALRSRGTVIGPDAVAAQVPLLAPVAGALWAPGEAHVDSRALGQALTVAVLKAGGTLLPNEAAVTLDERDGQVAAVRTAYGHYRADAYLLAAGAWSGLLEDVPVTPVKGEMIALETPPGFTAPVIWGNGIYMVPRGDRLLVGATVREAGFDTGLTDDARDLLRARAEALVPAARGWPLAEHWAGLRPKSPDGLPLLGPSRLSNLFVASGQYRNGILFAPAVADRMAALMRGQGNVIPDFDPRRFQG
jgi:glycine oxidase